MTNSKHQNTTTHFKVIIWSVLKRMSQRLFIKRWTACRGINDRFHDNYSAGQAAYMTIVLVQKLDQGARGGAGYHAVLVTHHNVDFDGLLHMTCDSALPN